MCVSDFLCIFMWICLSVKKLYVSRNFTCVGLLLFVSRNVHGSVFTNNKASFDHSVLVECVQSGF